MPIECKRLTTPVGKERDEREYLISKFSSTRGVHRSRLATMVVSTTVRR